MDFKAKRIVLPVPATENVTVQREIAYKSVGDQALCMDIYHPAGASNNALRPAVLFVHGDAPPDVLFDAKDWGQYRSWGELAASGGMVGVTFTHRSTEGKRKLPEAMSDVTDLVGYLRANAPEFGIDMERLGVWVCSAGGPIGLTPLLNGRLGPVRCAAALYPLLDLSQLPAETLPPGITPQSLTPFSPVEALQAADGPLPPLLIALAGQDHPVFRQAANRFVAAALERNVDLELINYPEGRHGFDMVNDTERSRQVIRRVMEFFTEHLV